MSKTDVYLYRAVRGEQFPDGATINEKLVRWVMCRMGRAIAKPIKYNHTILNTTP